MKTSPRMPVAANRSSASNREGWNRRYFQGRSDRDSTVQLSMVLERNQYRNCFDRHSHDSASSAQQCWQLLSDSFQYCKQREQFTCSLIVAPPAFPQLTTTSLNPARQFQLSLTGDTGVTFVIESSTNLIDWTAITNILNLTGLIEFADPIGTNSEARFYRAQWLPQ